MGRQGSCPTVAPVKPYTEFADIFNANCRPFCTARIESSVAFAMSIFAFFRAARISSKIIGNTPWATKTDDGRWTEKQHERGNREL